MKSRRRRVVFLVAVDDWFDSKVADQMSSLSQSGVRKFSCSFLQSDTMAFPAAKRLLFWNCVKIGTSLSFITLRVDFVQRGGHSGTRNALIEAAERELRAAEQELRAAIHKYNWLYQNWICRKTNKAIGFDAMRFGSPCISPSVNNGRKSGASRTIFAFFIFIFDSMLKVLALLNMVHSIS
jgi:hypothetical protein